MDKLPAGLFFGSFNPIHTGHLVIAKYMLEFTDLAEIWFVVSPHNPLKDFSTLARAEHRMEMVKLAIENEKRFKVSDIEFSLPLPSFTISTLAALEEKYPSHAFSIIMGSDGLETFHKWKDYQTIISDYKRYVYPRPGTDWTQITKIENGALVEAPLLDISSTFIRRAIKDGKDLRYFLPEKVWLYIHHHGLYR